MWRKRKVGSSGARSSRDEVAQDGILEVLLEWRGRHGRSNRGHGRALEDPTDHRRCLERSPFARRQGVQSSPNERLDAVRHPYVGGLGARMPAIAAALDDPFLDQHSDHFFDVERVALGAIQDPLAELGG